MIEVQVEVDGKRELTQVSEETFELLQDGACLRGRPIEWYLFRVVKEYGSLTEKNILKFMDEKWIL